MYYVSNFQNSNTNKIKIRGSLKEKTLFSAEENLLNLWTSSWEILILSVNVSE